MTDEFRYEGFIAGAAYEDANAMLDWLSRVFGFRERSRYVDQDGIVQQAEMHMGDTYRVTDPEGYHWSFMQRLGTPYVQRIPTEEGGWEEILAEPSE